MMIDFTIAIKRFNPDIVFINRDNIYDNIVILSDHEKPSLAELELAWQEYEAEQAILAELHQRRMGAIAELDTRAEAERLKYITDGAGKAMAYQQNSREVERWLNGLRHESMFPLATQYAKATGIGMQSVLSLWSQKINDWAITGGLIEANLAKNKMKIMTMDVSPDEFSEFVNQVDFYAEVK